jgi:hypothetical protein
MRSITNVTCPFSLVPLQYVHVKAFRLYIPRSWAIGGEVAVRCGKSGSGGSREGLLASDSSSADK